jgi:hypothetical protein
MGIEERVKENAKREGFEYMCFRNIPTSVQDFKEKERSWKGFEKALEVIGLNSRKVLARLEKGQPPYENLHKQNVKCQQAYMEYSSERTTVEDKPKQRTVRLREKTNVVLKGRSENQKKDNPKENRATSSKPAKELEELNKALDRIGQKIRLGTFKRRKLTLKNLEYYHINASIFPNLRVR